MTKLLSDEEIMQILSEEDEKDSEDFVKSAMNPPLPKVKTGHFVGSGLGAGSGVPGTTYLPTKKVMSATKGVMSGVFPPAGQGMQNPNWGAMQKQAMVPGPAQEKLAANDSPSYTEQEEALIRADEREKVALRLAQEMKVLDKDQQEMMQLAIDSIMEMGYRKEELCDPETLLLDEEIDDILSKNKKSDDSDVVVSTRIVPPASMIPQPNLLAVFKLKFEYKSGYTNIWKIVDKGWFRKKYMMEFIASVPKEKYAELKNYKRPADYVAKAEELSCKRYEPPASWIAEKESQEVTVMGDPM